MTFPQIERALAGRPVGFTTTLRLTPEKTFGPRDLSLTFTDSVDNVPAGLRHVGAEPDAENESGEARNFWVTRIEEGRLTVAANHPYADRTLAYEVKIVGIRQASPDEVASGAPSPGLSKLV